MSDKKEKGGRYTTLAVGEEAQDGGLPPGVGVKTIEAGEEPEDDGGAKRRPAPRPPAEEGEDSGR